jgi:hypothetical protein
MKDFYQGIRKLHRGWQIWIFVMGIVNFLIPAFYFHRLEAQLSIAAMLAGMIIGLILVKVQGFTKLLGWMHVFWVPLVAFFIFRMELFPITDSYGLWIRVLVVINGTSLIIDTMDVIQFYKNKPRLSY